MSKKRNKQMENSNMSEEITNQENQTSEQQQEDVVSQDQAQETAVTTVSDVVVESTTAPVVQTVEEISPMSIAPQVIVKEAKSGVVLENTASAPGKEAPQAVKAAIAKQTVTVNKTVSSFDQKIALVLESGSTREKSVVVAMKQYIDAMQPGKPMDHKQGVIHQQNLWRLMLNVVNNEDSFEKCFGLLINFFREAKDGALHERYVFRFMEHLTIGQDASFAFLAMINLLKITASTNNRKDVKKQVDINRTMNSVYTEDARQRVQSYFS